MRSWQRASGWLLLALAALALLGAGGLGPPRRTLGAPGGHRGERVGEAKNPGPEERAWTGLAQLTGSQPPKRLRGKQKTPRTGAYSGNSSGGAAGSSSCSSCSSCSRGNHNDGAKNRSKPTPPLGSAAAGLGPGARDHRATATEVGSARGFGSQGKVRASSLAPYPLSAFEGCRRCKATKAQGRSPGPGPPFHAKKADGTPAPGCFLSGLRAGGAPFGKPGSRRPQANTAAAGRRVCAAQSPRRAAWARQLRRLRRGRGGRLLARNRTAWAPNCSTSSRGGGGGIEGRGREGARGREEGRGRGAGRRGAEGGGGGGGRRGGGGGGKRAQGGRGAPREARPRCLLPRKRQRRPGRKPPRRLAATTCAEAGERRGRDDAGNEEATHGAPPAAAQGEAEEDEGDPAAAAGEEPGPEPGQGAEPETGALALAAGAGRGGPEARAKAGARARRRTRTRARGRRQRTRKRRSRRGGQPERGTRGGAS